MLNRFLVFVVNGVFYVKTWAIELDELLPRLVDVNPTIYGNTNTLFQIATKEVVLLLQLIVIFLMVQAMVLVSKRPEQMGLLSLFHDLQLIQLIGRDEFALALISLIHGPIHEVGIILSIHAPNRRHPRHQVPPAPKTLLNLLNVL